MPRLTREVFRDLYERTAPLVYRRALSILRAEADAWDVVQEVFERFLAASAGFRFEANPATYLYRTTINVSFNLARARGRRWTESVGSSSGEDVSGARAIEARSSLRRL